MFLEEVFDVLHVESVVHVWIGLQCGRLQHLITASPHIEELRVLLIVVCHAGDLPTLPVQVAHVGCHVKGN